MQYNFVLWQYANIYIYRYILHIYYLSKIVEFLPIWEKWENKNGCKVNKHTPPIRSSLKWNDG